VAGSISELRKALMLKYIRLFRLPNLIIIALSQYMIQHFLILSFFIATYFNTEIFPAHLSQFQLALLIVSTVLIAAGGYVINDYFDVHIDEINKPGKNIVGKDISPNTAKTIFFVLSGIGIVIGFWLAFQIGVVSLGFLQVFTVVSLWMYSSQFKRRLLIGNFITSLLCALSILIVALFQPESYLNIVYVLWWAIPAFLLTFIRELIKDIEDIEGDELSQCKTAPIIWGITVTKGIIIFLIVILAAFITLLLYNYFFVNTVISFWYLESIFIIPLLALLYLVSTAGEKKDLHYASMFTKILMLAGILTLYPFWLKFLK
jgi:4-hydroxybenzoate polyprenyltransferase